MVPEVWAGLCTIAQKNPLGRLGDTWHIDEILTTIHGEQENRLLRSQAFQVWQEVGCA